MLKRLSTVRVDRVVSTLAARILSGTFETRSELPTERELAWEFGVSRRSVREAMARMESRGLLTTTPKRDWQIHPATRLGGLELVFDWALTSGKDQQPTHYFFETLDMMRSLVAQAAFLAAMHHDESDWPDMNAALTRLSTQSERFKEASSEELIEAEELLFCALAGAGKNTPLLFLLRTFHRFLGALPWELAARRRCPSLLESDLTSLREAIERRDGTLAAAIVDRALEASFEVWASSLRRMHSATGTLAAEGAAC